MWLADLATGWCLVGCGLIASRRRPESRSGELITASGFLWFVGNFSGSGGAVGTLSAQALFLHRGSLFQAALTFPTGRVRGRWIRVATIGGWAAAAVPAIWRNPTATVAVACALVLMACANGYGGKGRIDRPARLAALEAAAFLAAVIVGTTLLRAASTSDVVARITLVAYQAGVFMLAIWMAWWLVRARLRTMPIADRVVELNDETSGTLQDVLSVALGDPTLELAFAVVGGGHVDQSGRSLRLPPADGRVVTPIGLGGESEAWLVHDPAVLTDALVVEAVRTAVHLAASNARLQAEVRAQLTTLDDSRRRLLLAAEDERMRLERRLTDGVMQRLVRLQAQLDAIVDRPGEGTVSQRIARAADQLGHTRGDLQELALGLHPSVLARSGLAAALAALARSAPIAVDLRTSPERLPAEVEAACYYVASEALANVVKHARADHSEIGVDVTNGVVEVRISDDGAGGAMPERGSGLRGLSDRVESLGGCLQVDSPPGAGTVLVARIPIVAAQSPAVRGSA